VRKKKQQKEWNADPSTPQICEGFWRRQRVRGAVAVASAAAGAARHSVLHVPRTAHRKNPLQDTSPRVKRKEEHLVFVSDLVLFVFFRFDMMLLIGRGNLEQVLGTQIMDRVVEFVRRIPV
jgi:hypothetical protein